MKESIHGGHNIAIIGMAGRFPDASNITQFWENLCSGVNSVRPIPEDELELYDGDAASALNNPNYVKMAAPIEDADKFDAAFFNIFPKKAITMDPHQRVFLECCWHALEDGGYVPESYAGDIGVFAGCYMNTYLLASLRSNPNFIHELADVFHGGSFQNEIGFEKDYLATQVSYLLNLRGPSLTIQTACSTSLVAVTSACQSLAFRECDMALAGAATLRFPQKRGYLHEEGGMLSADGLCKTFDARADGTIFGNGVATILLKRLDDALSDGDDIYAVIRGWGINNDGDRKPGYTAPSAEGQIDAIAKAQKMADVHGNSITYIEAHGTGTSLGDPIEINALSEVFRRTTEEKQYCAIGSVKTNVGHLDCVAGIAGLIKSALSIKHAMIPPSLNFEHPNPRIDFANSPFFVNTKLKEWQRNGNPLRAGISSFGVGGTNAHVIIEESPLLPSTHGQTSVLENQVGQPYHLLPLSARSEQIVNQIGSELSSYLNKNPNVDLAEVEHTLLTGRRNFAYSKFIVASSVQESIEKLDNLASIPAIQKPIQQGRQHAPPSVVFMFPGQGSQHANMGRVFYQTEAIYRNAFDRCAEILAPHLGLMLTSLLFLDNEPTEEQQRKITQTAFAQPAICAMEYALAQLWISRNVRPSALIGHSVGEFTAACLAGILSLEEAMTIVALRGKMMQSLPSGQMTAVRLSAKELAPYLSDNVVIGAINSPQLSVISGPPEAVMAVQADLERDQVVCRPLHTSHAFHSKMMDPILPTFREAVSQMNLRSPQIPIVSTVTGRWLTEEEAQSPDYWTSNLRSTVHFADSLKNLFTSPESLLLEVGPGQALTTLARQNPERDKSQQVFPSCSHPKENTSDAILFNETTGRLWQAGVQVKRTSTCSEQASGRAPRRLHLPGYPFERKRFWYDTPAQPQANESRNLESFTQNEAHIKNVSRRCSVECESAEISLDAVADQMGKASASTRQLVNTQALEAAQTVEPDQGQHCVPMQPSTLQQPPQDLIVQQQLLLMQQQLIYWQTQALRRAQQQ